MFELFLDKKIQDGDPEEYSDISHLPGKRYRNRRTYDRYAVKHKSLTALNKSDIFNISDISERGICCLVSPQAQERLLGEQLYKCRIRYLDELFELNLRVKWKNEKYVGFSLEEPSPEVSSFVERIISPIKIALSLEKQKEIKNEKSHNYLIEHWKGSHETHIILGIDAKSKIQFWQIQSDKSCVMWDQTNDLSTGTVANRKNSADPWECKILKNVSIDNEKKQLAIDVFMAFNHDHSNQVIETLREDSDGIQNIKKIRP